MNATRRILGNVIIALLSECSESGLISDENHLTATNAIHHLKQEESYQLRAQEKHKGTNASTDKQIAISTVALPALEKAWDAWNQDDFVECISQLTLAIETDGTVPKVRRKREDSRGRRQVRQGKA